jgi:hypothetical protein
MEDNKYNLLECNLEDLATTTTGILVADHPGSPMLEVSKVGDLDY